MIPLYHRITAVLAFYYHYMLPSPHVCALVERPQIQCIRLLTDNSTWYYQHTRLVWNVQGARKVINQFREPVVTMSHQKFSLAIRHHPDPRHCRA